MSRFLKLSPAEYDAAEALALRRCGYSQVAAFGTKTFEIHNFPTHIEDERELFRYADMFVSTVPSHLDGGQFFREASVKTDYSPGEIALLTKISRGVEHITADSFAGPTTVFFNHLTAVGLFRAIQAIAEIAGRPLDIFEVGPGCGYTGVMLGLMGHRYMSYDVTQAYYLWQNRIYGHFFGDEFVEAAANTDFVPGRISHVPWWSYMNFHDVLPFEADIVVSNANLGEMHVMCLRYVARISNLMLSNSDIGIIMFASVGEQSVNSEATVFAELRQAGFEHKLSKQVHGWALPGGGKQRAIVDLLETSIPTYDPDKIGKTFAAREFIKISRDEMPEEFKFYAFISDWDSQE